jgi:hypothetical protein
MDRNLLIGKLQLMTTKIRVAAEGGKHSEPQKINSFDSFFSNLMGLRE